MAHDGTQDAVVPHLPPSSMGALVIEPMLADAGHSLLSTQCDGGLGGAPLIVFIAKMRAK